MEGSKIRRINTCKDVQKAFFFAHDIKKSDLNRHDSHTACNVAGRVSIEGKEYVIKDGDIVHFRYNV